MHSNSIIFCRDIYLTNLRSTVTFFFNLTIILIFFKFFSQIFLFSVDIYLLFRIDIYLLFRKGHFLYCCQIIKQRKNISFQVKNVLTHDYDKRKENFKY